MRNGQNNKRMRNRNNNPSRGDGGRRGGQNPMTRVFESNGPDIKIRGTASHVAEKYVQLARDAGASGLCPHWSSIHAMDVRLAHQAGLSVHPWVTSDTAIIRRLVSLDVDSIASNDPDIVAVALCRVRAIKIPAATLPRGS